MLLKRQKKATSSTKEESNENIEPRRNKASPEVKETPPATAKVPAFQPAVKEPNPEEIAEKYLVEVKKDPQEAANNENALMQSVKFDQLMKEENPLEKKPEDKKSGTVLGNLDDLFQIEEEVVKSHLDDLIVSLPDVTCQEILEELNQVSSLLSETNSQADGKIKGVSP